MQVLDYPAVIHEMYAVHLVLKRFGFDAKDIYVGYTLVLNSPTTDRLYVVVLKTQGLEFVIPCGVHPEKTESEEVGLKLWGEFSRLIKTATIEDLDECYHRSKISRDPFLQLKLIGTIHRRGFRIPNTRGINMAQIDAMFGDDLPNMPGPIGNA